MARGSSSTGTSSGSTSSMVEMPGETGQLDNRGRAIIRKKFFINSENNLGQTPPLSGYRPTNVTYNKLLENAYEQSVDYVAEVPATSAVVETLGGSKGTFEMFCSYESIPIEMHPKIQDLTVKYGGYFTPDGFAKWPPLYFEGGGGGLSSGSTLRNPMYGVTRYKDVSMTFRHTFYTTGLSKQIFNEGGKQVTRLPAGFPAPPGPIDSNGRQLRRRWMKQIPAVTREGNSYRVVQDYVLLDNSSAALGLYETAGV